MVCTVRSMIRVAGRRDSICIQHVSGLEYIHLKQRAIKLGQKLKSLQETTVSEMKKLCLKFCSKFGLPFGFDGPIWNACQLV